VVGLAELIPAIPSIKVATQKETIELTALLKCTVHFLSRGAMRSGVFFRQFSP